MYMYPTKDNNISANKLVNIWTKLACRDQEKMLKSFVQQASTYFVCLLFFFYVPTPTASSLRDLKFYHLIWRTGNRPVASTTHNLTIKNQKHNQLSARPAQQMLIITKTRGSNAIRYGVWPAEAMSVWVHSNANDTYM